VLLLQHATPIRSVANQAVDSQSAVERKRKLHVSLFTAVTSVSSTESVAAYAASDGFKRAHVAEER